MLMPAKNIIHQTKPVSLPRLGDCAQQGAVGVQDIAVMNSDQYSARWTTWRDSSMFPTGLQAFELGNKMITQMDEHRGMVLFIPFQGYRHF
jgi:hypothetical protein